MAGFENSAGIDVSNYYGPRNTGGSVGAAHTQDDIHQLKIQFTGFSVNDGYLPPVVIPRGAHFVKFRLRVDEAFVVSAGGTLTFGGTAPGTNGVVLSETELENIGTKVPASDGVGTWDVASATGTTAAEAVTQAISGTIGATSGKATLIAEYVFNTLV